MVDTLGGGERLSALSCAHEQPAGPATRTEALVRRRMGAQLLPSEPAMQQKLLAAHSEVQAVGQADTTGHPTAPPLRPPPLGAAICDALLFNATTPAGDVDDAPPHDGVAPDGASLKFILGEFAKECKGRGVEWAIPANTAEWRARIALSH